MRTIRFFSGGRGAGARGVASEIMRLEIQKKGKMPTTDRFKYVFKKRMEENRKKALGGKSIGFSLPGSLKEARRMSKKAEQALKEIAQKKASKEAKAMRKMVFVQPRVYSNGRIVRDGKIFDIAGNIVAKVNTKNGKIGTMMGWSLGKYKPRSVSTDLTIQTAIDKYSPYYINLRKMQAMQQGQQGYGVWGPTGGQDVINVYGRSTGHDYAADTSHSSGVYGDYSSDMAGPRQNVGATAWGAMSDNVWNTFTDNVWGTSTDTVWGTNTSDVWGGIGGNPYGKSVQFWGTGNGRNYLKGLAARVATFFGLHLKSQASRAAFHEAVNTVRNSRTAAHDHGQQSTRAGVHDHGPQTTRAVDHHSNAAATTRAAAPTTRH